MQPVYTRDWPNSKAEASLYLEEVAKQVRLLPLTAEPRQIAAVETTCGTGGKTLYCCAAVMSFPELEEIECVFSHGPTGFSYEPGLLHFREGPVIAQTLAKIVATPDLLMVHGHGIAHPQRCGSASSLGVVFDIPTVGCCRKLLAGNHREVAPTKGSAQPIILDSDEVGMAYRSKDKVKPIFVSPGHLCDLASAVSLTKRCLRGFRQPEPLRLAHLMAHKYKRRSEKKNQATPSEVY